MKHIILVIFISVSSHIISQNTVGVTLFEENTQSGYTFFSNFNGTKRILYRQLWSIDKQMGARNSSRTGCIFLGQWAYV